MVKLTSKFVMKDMGEPSMFLGMNLKQTETGNMNIILKSSIERIATNYNITVPLKKLNTPMAKGFETNHNINSKETSEEEHKMFRSLVGSLIYFAQMGRPDIAFAVSFLSKFHEKPLYAHLKAAIRVLQYLMQTKETGLTYDKNNDGQLKFRDFRYLDKTQNIEIEDYDEETEFRITVITVIRS